MRITIHINKCSITSFVILFNPGQSLTDLPLDPGQLPLDPGQPALDPPLVSDQPPLDPSQPPEKWGVCMWAYRLLIERRSADLEVGSSG